MAAADSLTLIRHEWADGYRRLEGERDDPGRYHRLLEQVDLVTDELRKKVGQTFTLDQLETAYRDAERWARELVSERALDASWPRDLSLVVAAAFHIYQRGAVDYLA
jgi:hypothetical protein